jgi:hypothetical protein
MLTRDAQGMSDMEAASAGGISTPSVSINPVATNIPIPSRELIGELTRSVFSNDPALHLRATQQFRRLLSIERQPPIQQVIETGVVKAFVNFLQQDDNPVSDFSNFNAVH